MNYMRATVFQIRHFQWFTYRFSLSEKNSIGLSQADFLRAVPIVELGQKVTLGSR